ncbi:MAG: DsbA family protein [Pseudomonadota bacterium]
MIRAFVTAAAISLTATAASAFDIDAMSEAEREAFRSEIRSYLMENPEVLMEAIGVLEERRAAEAVAQEGVLLEQYRASIFEDGHSWIGGNPDGDVTIVEFLDYRCGFCKRAHPDVQSLLASDGNIRIIVKEFPILGPESELASRFAIAAKIVEGDDMYSSVHDALMEWSGPVNQGALGRVAKSAGIADVPAVLAEMNSERVSEIIAQNRMLAQALNINGTPSFIMGENFVRGYVDLQQMQSIVAGIRETRG